MTETDNGRWHLTHGEQVLDVVTADNQATAALEVAHLVPGAGKWEQLNRRQYRYRSMPHSVKEMLLQVAGR